MLGNGVLVSVLPWVGVRGIDRVYIRCTRTYRLKDPLRKALELEARAVRLCLYWMSLNKVFNPTQTKINSTQPDPAQPNPTQKRT